MQENCQEHLDLVLAICLKQRKKKAAVYDPDMAMRMVQMKYWTVEGIGNLRNGIAGIKGRKAVSRKVKKTCFLLGNNVYIKYISYY